MKNLRDLGLILALAILWAGSGYAIGIAFKTVIGVQFTTYSPRLLLGCLNLIVGLLWLKGMISEPTTERLFFEGPKNDNEGDIRIGCLWVAPLALLVYSGFMWLATILLRLFAK